MTKRTALITGASAGLGKDFAELFAADGHDVILVARREQRLRELASEISSKHGVAAHVEACDLADPDARTDLISRVAEHDVDFLVNNAGFGSMGKFWTLPESGELGQIRVNIEALVHLTHALLPAMVERKFGRVLNIASTAAFQAGPNMAVYYATKAFVVSFSEAIAHELKDTGVTVTAHCPGPVATEFGEVSGNGKSVLFQTGAVATSIDVARHAYAAMHGGKVLKVHGAMNAITAFSTRFAPRSLLRPIVARVNTEA